ncbi:hypothetical protein [Streptosporangium roseum]|uniref:Lipoprotein n=1 Tax=Streptosporangium roseum (strain ATCC 12428 / DSM 43021 / JCM 3005 / KCTC 9067 / NCIMB 10171 / NRRL 2505 / NI 9100) TaxID=479432 RepID=D2AYH3_STRRD|nr:hypothetical protein [Streptosporangium roseum]ACZ88956.1 hypothetical protein Sros_6228 [Streptosporangium roseum DSM 43021]
MPRFTVMIIAFAALVVGCTGGEAVNRPAMTQAQALVRIEQLIKETVDAITPKPRLDLYRPSLNINGCFDPTDGGSEDRVVISRSYYLRDIAREQIAEVARQVKQHWEQQGHYIEGASKSGLNISGHSQPDDFLLSLSLTGDNDVLGLGVTSPCIWPSGTPEPSSETSVA